ncbi:transglutaminase family protein [Halobaculum litoreum]|uniref:Transglutaminase family protein n=1 Tax=Halobaculum litoreum TaxID=3031998 RepID=A0ABD5XLZ4_9EURY
MTDHGGLKPGTTLIENDTYTVVSERPTATPGQLRRAGVDYPGQISSRYTQLPESTPDRVGERTAEVLNRAEAGNPYDAAVAVERYLERTKEYSLDVSAPQGNVADRFLFEMDSGYCVYYATTMVAMLRSQGVPARFVVGYTEGQRVAEDEWVVRGLDSHAWVEVYFPDHGWVRFDPTPGGPREAAEQSSIDTAREDGAENVDVAGSENGSYETPTATADPAGSTPGPNQISAVNPDEERFGTAGATAAGGGLTANLTNAGAGGGAAGDGGDDGWTPTRSDVAVGLAGLVGLVAGARRFGLTGRVRRTVWLLRQPRADPSTDAQRAFRRLEYLAAVVHRPRRPGRRPASSSRRSRATASATAPARSPTPTSAPATGAASTPPRQTGPSRRSTNWSGTTRPSSGGSGARAGRRDPRPAASDGVTVRRPSPTGRRRRDGPFRVRTPDRI